MADAMWLPQPRQAFFAGVDRQYARAQRGRLDGLQQSGQVAPMHILDLCWGVGFGLCLSGYWVGKLKHEVVTADSLGLECVAFIILRIGLVCFYAIWR